MCMVLGSAIGGSNLAPSGQEDRHQVRILIIHFWKCFMFYLVLMDFILKVKACLNTIAVECVSL